MLLFFRSIIFVVLMMILPVTWAVSEKDIEEKLRPSTIYIKVEAESETGAIVESSGSGFVVGKGLVLTAKHVISLPKGSKRILEITGTPESSEMTPGYKLEVLARDPNYDFALLRIKSTTKKATSLPPVALGDPSQIKFNESTITALGFPLGNEFHPKQGKINAMGTGGTWITNIPLNPGDSGGPVFNEQGQVVAMVVSALKEAEGIKYVLPINFARNVLSPFGIEIPKATPIIVEEPDESSGKRKEGNVFKDCADCPEMMVIPGGEFEMGSNKGNSDDEKPVHKVRVPSFALGKTEITQGQWRALMGSNPSHIKHCGDDCPVEEVSWNDAQDFIQKLNAKTGKKYRLPSEAEWEYACRAGGQHEYCGSFNFDSVAWHAKNTISSTHPVGSKQPNAFGLYDMSGNVWEWVEDNYNVSYDGAPADGSAWQGDHEERVLRGGSWFSEPQNTRATNRSGILPVYRNNDVGFRVARMLP